MSTPVYERVKDLPVGSQVIFGKNTFNGKYRDGEEEIVWTILSNNHHMLDDGYPENVVTMITSNVIRYMSFDAKEPNNLLIDRQTGGNNRWRTSNIRQWLNSDRYAGQWFVPQNIGDSGTDNKDTPPTAEYMLNVVRNYPYYGDNGFLRSFNVSELEVMKPAKVKTMVPTPSESRNQVIDTTEDYIYLPSLTEITGLTNSRSAGEDGIGEGAYLLSDEESKEYRNARATELALINGSNHGLNHDTNKAYFLRSPAQGNSSDIRRYLDDGGNGSSVNVKPMSNDGIRPMVNIDESAVVIKEGEGLYRYVDNAKPYIVLKEYDRFDLDFSVYDFDGSLDQIRILLNGEQIDVFSGSGSYKDIQYKIPFNLLTVGNNSLEIVASDDEGLVGEKEFLVRLERLSVPVVGDKVLTKDGSFTVNEASIDDEGTLTLKLDKNLRSETYTDEVVEKQEVKFSPKIAVNNDYNSTPSYREMNLRAIEYNEDGTAIEQWEHVEFGKYAHVKVDMERENTDIDLHLSRVSQIFTYYNDEDI